MNVRCLSVFPLLLVFCLGVIARDAFAQDVIQDGFNKNRDAFSLRVERQLKNVLGNASPGRLIGSSGGPGCYRDRYRAVVNPFSKIQLLPFLDIEKTPYSHHVFYKKSRYATLMELTEVQIEKYTEVNIAFFQDRRTNESKEGYDEQAAYQMMLADMNRVLVEEQVTDAYRLMCMLQIRDVGLPAFLCAGFLGNELEISDQQRAAIGERSKQLHQQYLRQLTSLQTEFEKEVQDTLTKIQREKLDELLKFKNETQSVTPTLFFSQLLSVARNVENYEQAVLRTGHGHERAALYSLRDLTNRIEVFEEPEPWFYPSKFSIIDDSNFVARFDELGSVYLLPKLIATPVPNEKTFGLLWIKSVRELLDIDAGQLEECHNVLQQYKMKMRSTHPVADEHEVNAFVDHQMALILNEKQLSDLRLLVIALDEWRVGRVPLMVNGYLGHELEISFDQKLELVKIAEETFLKMEQLLKKAEKEHRLSVLPLLSSDQKQALDGILSQYRAPTIFDPNLLLAQMNFVEVLKEQELLRTKK